MRRRSIIIGIISAIATLAIAPLAKSKPARGSPRIILPSGKVVKVSDPIYPDSEFNWGDATKKGWRKIPTLEIEENIEKVARLIDSYRPLLNYNKIIVTSWYRDKSANDTAGGAKESYHLQGLAVDFKVCNISAKSVQAILRSVHEGGIGYYSNRIHIDARPVFVEWYREVKYRFPPRIKAPLQNPLA